MRTQAARPISHDEACVILGLPKGQTYSGKALEDAYRREFVGWSRKLVTAIRPADRTRAAGMLRLIQEAHAILGAGTPPHGRSARPPVPKHQPPPAAPLPQPQYVPTPPSSGLPEFLGNIFSAIGDFFEGVIKGLKNAAFAMEVNGVPKLAIALIFIVGGILIIHGCASILHLTR
jgi:hypothetical protein